MKRHLITTGLLSACAILLGAPAHAQVGTARGKVVDAQGQPVPDAKILIEAIGAGVNRKYETKTSKKGEFTQVGMPSGGYRFTASKEGFQASYIEARVNLGDPTFLPELRLQSAAAVAAAAQEKAQQELGPAFKKANDFAQAGQLDEAEAAYKEILARDAGIPEVHYNLGYVYSQKKDWASAEAAYLKAIELKPSYSDAYSSLAKVYQDSGQREKAAELMAKSAAANESDPKVQFNLAIFHLNSGKYDEAAAVLKKVEAIDPANAEVQYHLATLALNQGKTDECVARLEKYLAMSPKNEQNVQTAQGLLHALKKK